MLKHLIFLILFYISLPAWSQNSKEVAGNKHFSLFDYEKAITNYEKAEPLTLNGKRNLRTSYLRQERYADCERLSAQIVTDVAHNSEDIFEYVTILRTNKKYETSNEWMKKYEDLVGNDQRIMADHMNRSRIADLMVDQGNMSVENLGLNSENIEFAPSLYGDKIVFTSTSIIYGQ
ncbi:MAG: hypothetical protein IT221_03475 [Fluviicola sp.]|nr:hypothetical protein [Fluviicola sp.]